MDQKHHQIHSAIKDAWAFVESNSSPRRPDSCGLEREGCNHFVYCREYLINIWMDLFWSVLDPCVTAGLVEATEHTQVKKKRKKKKSKYRGKTAGCIWLAKASKLWSHRCSSRLMIIIGPNTKISQYSIKLGLKELYKNALTILLFFFSFTCTQKEGIEGRTHGVWHQYFSK